MSRLTWLPPRTEPSDLGEHEIHDSADQKYRVARSHIALGVTDQHPDRWYAIWMGPPQRILSDHRTQNAATESCERHARSESPLPSDPEEPMKTKTSATKTATAKIAADAAAQKAKAAKRVGSRITPNPVAPALKVAEASDAKVTKAARPAGPSKTTRKMKALGDQPKLAIAKGTAKPKPAKPAGEKKMSALDAAAQVLSKAGKPMSTAELITEMAAKGLWTSPGGKTPAATLYAAILREMTTKGKDSRFKKVAAGQFEAA